MEISEKQKKEICGTVEKYLVNRHRDFSAIELATGDERIIIDFQPHTAKMIMENAGPGSFFKAICKTENAKDDPKGKKKPKLVLCALKGILGEDLPLENLMPRKIGGEPIIEILRFDGFEFVKGKRGELLGIKSGSQLVHIDKELQNAVGMIAPNSQLEIAAIRRSDAGFVNQEYDEVFHLQKLTVEGREIYSKQ